MDNKRISICVGVSHYKNYPRADLKFAASDAEKVHAVLKDPARGAFDTCHLLLNENATKDSILKALKNSLFDPKLGPNDIVLFYFSGHGRLDKSENLYLVPHDVCPLEVDPDEVDVTTVLHLTDIELLLDNTKVGTVIFILDACHSGGSGKLLGHLKYKDSSNIIFIGASRFSEKAYESAEIEQSRFTLALLESFSQTPNFENWITLQQALGYVHRVMPAIAKEKRQQMLEITSHANNQNIKLVQNPRFSIDAVEFIDEVEELCQLSDADIVSDMGDLPGNIFIMNERKAFGTQNATLIGCFYNVITEISDTEIELFNKIEEQFSIERRINSALVISQKEFSHAIKNEFSKSVEFRTLNQMIWELISFQRYLLNLKREYEEGNEDRPLQPPLKEVYVPLSGEMASIQNDETAVPIDQVDLAIESWLKTENQPMSMLLGSYGTGKTTVTRVISYKQAQLLQNRTISDARIPVIFPLRIFPKYNVVDIGGFIVSYLRNFPGLKNVDFDAFQKMNHSGKLLLIFDGFDEMGTRVDRNILKRNFAAICSLVKSGREKIIVSSRPEVFLTDAEQREIFSTLESKYATTMFRLHSLSDDQFKEYVEKRVKYLQKSDRSLDDWIIYYDQITSIPDLKEIATRPVILEITISTLPTLIKENVTISKASLYEYYLRGEIERQVVHKGRDFLLNLDQRLTLIQFVALYLLAKDQIELSAEDILNVIRANLLPEQKVDVEGFARDFLACSFMLREGQSYRFSHLSFLEYLVARTLISEIQGNKFYVLDNIIIKTEVAHFLIELIKNSPISDTNEQVLWDWIKSPRQVKERVYDIQSLRSGIKAQIRESRINQDQGSFRLVKVIKQDEYLSTIQVLKITEEFEQKLIFSQHTLIQGTLLHYNVPLEETYALGKLFGMNRSTGFIGGNSLTLLNLLNRLPKVQICDTFNLSGANISGFEFIESSFQGTIFREGRFTKTNFLNSHWENTDFGRCNFGGVTFNGETLSSCDFRECNFSEVTFDVRTLTKCDFRECNFSKVTFNGETLSSCDFRECNFSEVTFDVRTLTKCDFRECNFAEIKFHFGSIIQSIFENANFHHSQFNTNLIEECDFKDAKLSEVLFEQSTIGGSNLSKILMSETFYEECHLKNCFFSEGYQINSTRGVTITNPIFVSEDEEVIRKPTKRKTKLASQEI